MRSRNRNSGGFARMAAIAAFIWPTAVLRAEDWPMYGRDKTRNPVSPELNAPVTADPVAGTNVLWRGKLGSITYATPVVSGGLVWIGTNRDEQETPGADLLCFRESDGKLLYRRMMLAPKGASYWWGVVGTTASPLIETDRMWLVTPQSEVVCLDITPLREGKGEPREIWKLDMAQTLGVVPRLGVMGGPQMCSIGASHGELIYVITGNGRRVSWEQKVYRDDPPNEKAPALLCLNKSTGDIVWQDFSPGTNAIMGEWSSPLVITVDGTSQVIAPQGDGWVRAFHADTGQLLWKFDMNPKQAKGWDRNFLVPPPVFYDGKVYVASGGYIEIGEGPGRLVCLDPRKRGDISLELADGNANPNAGAVWRLEEFGRAMGTVAVHDGLVIAAGFSGLVYCLDATTGEEFWRYNLKSHTLSSPLIVDRKIYLADEDGDVEILEFSRKLKALGTFSVGAAMYASPVFANGVLYIASNESLYAIKAPAARAAGQTTNLPGEWPQWRGADRSNASRETGLLQEWPEDGPPRVWTAAGIGLGIHSVSVAEGRVFTTGNFEGHEIAFALDAATGGKIWDHRLDATIPESAQMRWMTQRSPTLDGERVYILSMSGKLICLRADTGERTWELDYPTEFGTRRHPWGYRDAPLVDGDRLICTPYGTSGYITALDKSTGETIWMTTWADPPVAGHASLVVSEAGGVRQYVVFHGRGLAGFAAADGKLLWNYTRPKTRTASTYTPLVRGDLICSLNGYGGGAVLLKLANTNGVWTTSELYETGGSFNAFQDNTAQIGEHIYTSIGVNKPACIDFLTGKVLWQAAESPNGKGRAALTYADGHLYIRYANGVMSFVEAQAKEYREKGSFAIPDHEESLGVTAPVIAGGRLYLRDNNRLHCFDVSKDALGSKPQPRQVAISLSHNNAERADRPERRFRTGRDRAPDAVFVPTPHDVVTKMLEVGEVTKQSVLIDLGSGDGRILIAAAKRFGCEAIGYEIDKRLVESSRETVRNEKLEGLVKIEHEDIFTQDFSKADVLTVFLYPRLMERLIPQLNKLKPGSRIVSHQFEIPGIAPDRIYTIDSAETGDKHRILLWTVPLDAPNQKNR